MKSTIDDYNSRAMLLGIVFVGALISPHSANNFKIGSFDFNYESGKQRLARDTVAQYNKVTQQPQLNTIINTQQDELETEYVQSKPISHTVKRYADNIKEDEENDNVNQEQNFFQSFAPLFQGHSRPLLYPEHSFRGPFKSASTLRELPFAGINDNLLGSGNFGVIKGGTYYTGDREDSDFASDDGFSYIGNGHSRPSFYKRNPLPAYRNGGDFFANFRDFADITAPTKSAFSQYYVVYVNKNDTIVNGEEKPSQPGKKVPRNIIEQLAMMDSTNSENDQKQSKIKQKLSVYKEQAENKNTNLKLKHFSSAKEIPEPLLALS